MGEINTRELIYIGKEKTGILWNIYHDIFDRRDIYRHLRKLHIGKKYLVFCGTSLSNVYNINKEDITIIEKTYFGNYLFTMFTSELDKYFMSEVSYKRELKLKELL